MLTTVTRSNWYSLRSNVGSHDNDKRLVWGVPQESCWNVPVILFTWLDEAHRMR